MSRKKAPGNNSGAISTQGDGVIVLAGEDRNDCEILAALIRAHRPDLTSAAKMVRINDPVRLRKKKGTELSAAVKALVGKARAKALQQKATLHGFVVHEDLDGFTDDRYKAIRKSVSAELTRQIQPFSSAFALAAWESEAWLMLFPEAFPKVRPRWKMPTKLRDRDTGKLESPKDTLRHSLGTPTFHENDGPSIARAALKHGLLAAPRGRNQSYEDLIGDLKQWR